MDFAVTVGRDNVEKQQSFSCQALGEAVFILGGEVGAVFHPSRNFHFV